MMTKMMMMIMTRNLPTERIPIGIRSVGIPCAHLDGDGDDDDDDYFNSHGDDGDEDDIGPPGCLPGAQ